jgi:hypothetical protein
MEEKYLKYITEMTLGPAGIWHVGKTGSNVNSLFDVLREYISDAEKSYWSDDLSGSIKSLNTVRTKIIKDMIEAITLDKNRR